MDKETSMRCKDLFLPTARGWTEEIIDICCLNFNKPNRRKVARTLWAALPLWVQDNLI